LINRILILDWRWPLALLTIVVFGWSLVTEPLEHLPDFDGSALPEPIRATAERDAESPRLDSRFVSGSVELHSHASSITELGNGNLLAVWYAGSREGAGDVEILSAVYDRDVGTWSDNQSLASRAKTAASLRRHIRKLGNPTLATAPDGRVWLFYVSVSVGGWACSQVNLMYSDDHGASWSEPRRLITSPLFNMSTLVRGTPIFHADGSIGVPVYHESLGKFSEYLRIDRAGEILDKSRMGRGKHSLQPSVAVMDDDSAWALIRYAGAPPNRLMVSRTDNAGNDWTAPVKVDVPNPNASVSAVGFNDGVLVALNDLEDGRHRLSLYWADGSLASWRQLAVLDESSDPEGGFIDPTRFAGEAAVRFEVSAGAQRLDLRDRYLASIDDRSCGGSGCEYEYEYPSLIRSRDGGFHLTYTWHKSLIKHVSFNEAWLEGLL
jgi:predicted neuraminidase